MAPLRHATGGIGETERAVAINPAGHERLPLIPTIAPRRHDHRIRRRCECSQSPAILFRNARTFRSLRFSLLGFHEHGVSPPPPGKGSES
jgi:hypothetical protein